MTPEARRVLIDQYETAPQRLRAAFACVPTPAVDWRPGTGKWSVHEIVCHCGDSELNAASRIRYAICEKEPLILGYDQDQWAVTLDYASQSLDGAFTMIDATRVVTVPLLRRVSEDRWTRPGRHSEVGAYSPEIWLGIYAVHIDTHIAQMERTVAAWRLATGGG